MKIFNWVRRFNHKDEAGQGATNEVTQNGKDSKLILLEHVAFDSVFDGWKEGILAIGTLGFDPALLKGSEHKEDTYLCEISRKELFVADNGDEDHNGEQELEMEFPLVLKACKHGFFHDQKDDHQQCDEVSKTDDRKDVEDLEGVDVDDVKRARKIGQRTTLADLFSADSETNLLKNKWLANVDHVNGHFHTTESNKKHASNDDRVALISNTKLTTKDNTTHIIKKINRMMKKILKKKIHPDVENQNVVACVKPMRLPGS
ncbi:protein TILLER ANGLE CONTROL 1 [Lactuca sativa]|uniref:protein TILLER ANGLE CONTROL 1 n=1 Tax=Lactuca sativa TaxID=4236 RepID=UPI000CD8308D|nr:protein TILLER ANGLE CONTROL 1 [Lactuca sativa]